MLYLIGKNFEQAWGPLRLFKSHSFLLALGAMCAAAAVLFLLPRLWDLLPRDRGKVLAADGGAQSAGKPTGAGFLFSLISLPVALLVTPMNFMDAGIVVCLLAVMLFGYLDDRSIEPWGELRKGLLDAAVCLAVSILLYSELSGGAGGVEMWWPFFKGSTLVPWWAYMPGATLLLWISVNATNCSDGVDGLAGSLTLISLFSISVFLYVVAGNATVAEYLLVPTSPVAPRWAILTMTLAGALAGYLWYNADPSKVLMGDAGSRFLGLAVGTAVLVSGNPFLLLVFAPMVLMNGGMGLVKLALLRIFRKLGFDVTIPGREGAAPGRRIFVVRVLQRVSFPLHDHFRRKLQWSKGQILMRFILIQAFISPLLFVIFVKIR